LLFLGLCKDIKDLDTTILQLHYSL
jgi:hypothetical protein